MNKRIISSLLLVLFIFLLLLIINRKLIIKTNIENFKADDKKDDKKDKKKDDKKDDSSDPWNTDRNELEDQKKSLNPVQKDEVTNMINSISESKLKKMVVEQSPLLVGPPGPQGVQGPAGSLYIASGRLINKSGSFNKYDENNNYFVPKFSVTRSEGTNSTSSLAFMDDSSSFSSVQNWQLEANNFLKNRYDDNCLTMSNTDNKIYIDKCTDNNQNQKWTWDDSNRIVSTTNSNNIKLKCIGLSKPEINITTTNIPGCKGDSCSNNVPRRYLISKDCEINNVNEDEIWDFT